MIEHQLNTETDVSSLREMLESMMDPGHEDADSPFNLQGKAWDDDLKSFYQQLKELSRPDVLLQVIPRRMGK